jgi:phage antirepressor YoqD-like protein
MSDDHPRPDIGQLDTSPHDQTPDVSLDNAVSLNNAVSIREAATRVGVTEKTIRRWIKSNRLHAVKLD